MGVTGAGLGLRCGLDAAGGELSAKAWWAGREEMGVTGAGLGLRCGLDAADR
jgi:hypothetical protein